MFYQLIDLNCRCKMSVDVQDLEEAEEGRVVTDSVHERFRQMRVHCDDCNRDISGNWTAIRKHFDDLHPSDRHCCYCKGKVFTYRTIMTIDNRESSDSFVYHKCKHKEQLQTNASKEST